ncbi:AgmX/PglI C-terminal domain-containing protein [Sorangium sp. So ce281]|uniref:AgmX/PglI C-terminal domain-containing protein n=1 Tax=unclassified Sorangium TaxID=2621164 RepID=UPI003F5FB627
MSSRRTGVVLILALALAAGCGAPPPAAQSPAQPASEGPTGSASPEPTTSTTSAPPEPKPAAPPPDAQVPAAATPVEAPPPRPAASRPDGNVRPGAATATGTLGGNISESQVRDVVEKHGELFDECYKIGVKSSPKFTGKVTVKATIGPTGRVNRADVVRSTAKNQQVDRCVADAFEKMQFPSPQGGVTTVITFPIEFSGVELVQP